MPAKCAKNSTQAFFAAPGLSYIYFKRIFMDASTRRFPANRTMPDCAILPVLHYRDVAEAIEWLSHAFGFTERWRIANHRAQLAYEGGAIAITELSAGPGAKGDGGLGTRHQVMMRVKNADEHCAQARRGSATILQEPQDFFYGERQYTAEDLGGHRWTFSETINDLAPEDWGGVSGGAK